jgi:hypothetical protein
MMCPIHRCSPMVVLVAVVAALLNGHAAAQVGVIRSSAQTLLDNDPEIFEYFGRRVAADREWVAVAAYADHWSDGLGTVSMFRRTNGVLEFTQELQSSSGQPLERFGQNDVKLEGGLLVVSTTLYNGFAEVALRVGRAYVFELIGGTWQETGQLEASDEMPGGTGFGNAVAIAGGDILVSRPWLDSFQNPVYVFRKVGGVWQEVQRWLSPNESPNTSTAGYRLAADGDWAVVADCRPFGGRRAYVLHRDSSGVWQLDERIPEPSPSAFSLFGSAVAIERDLLAVGQPYWENHASGAGKVYLYRRSSSGWTLEQTLTGSDNVIVQNGSGTFNDAFGLDIDIECGRVLVGARQTRVNGRFIGQAYIFEQTPAGWVEAHRLRTYVDDWGSPQVGHGVAFTGDVAIAGAQDATQPDFRSGAAAVFRIPFGASTCAGNPNSTGSGSVLTMQGDRRVFLGDLTASVDGLPPNAAGYLLASRWAGHVPTPAGSQGDLCLGGGIARIAPPIAIADAAGHVQVAVPMQAIPLGAPTPILAGETWHFQFWHRDVNPAPTSNFSSAIGVTFR